MQIQKRIAKVVLTMDLTNVELTDAFFRGYFKSWSEEHPFPTNVELTITTVSQLTPHDIALNLAQTTSENEIEIPIDWFDECQMEDVELYEQ